MIITEKGFLIRKIKTSGTSQAGKQWEKIDAIVDFEKGTLCITYFGEKANELEKAQEQSSHEFTFYPKSKEYNGKWFTSLNGLGVKASTEVNDIKENNSETEDLPF